MRTQRRGQALLEFAIIALVLFLLLAVILDFGRAIYAAQVIQQAADIAARELAQMPLSPETTFVEALADEEVKARIYDPGKLVLPQADFTVLAAQLPAVNRLLLPLMIPDEIEGQAVLRYPGAVVRDGDWYTVKIPHVVERSEDGVETIVWLDVLEPIRPADVDDDPAKDPFSMLYEGADNKRGLVAVRINYPFQAAAMSAYQTGPQQDEPPWNVPIVADDSGVTVTGEPLPDGQEPIAPDGVDRHKQTYSGIYGLGKQEALGRQVRPFRRLLSAQAVFRREIFR